MSYKKQLGEVVDATEWIAKLLKSDLSFGLANQVERLLAKMAEEAKRFHERRNALLAELGTPVADQPGRFAFSPESATEFAKQEKEAREVEIELPGDLLTIPDDVVIKPGEIVAGIRRFLKE